MDAILTWIVKLVLNFIVGRLTSAIQEHEAQVEEDKKQGIIDDANVKKYQEAKDRLSRHQSAVDLLNGVPGSP